MALFLVAVLIVICGIKVIQAVLVMTGMYKDPVLATFEVYGEEQIFSALYSLCAWGLATLYLTLFFFLGEGFVIGIGILLGTPLIAFHHEIQELFHRFQKEVHNIPQWYADLSSLTTREERRRIAYLWLRLPARTRLLYNANTKYFNQWVEQVLLTIA